MHSPFFLVSFVCVTLNDHTLIHSSAFKPLKCDKMQKKTLLK